jgi:hypothetical protein
MASPSRVPPARMSTKEPQAQPSTPSRTPSARVSIREPQVQLSLSGALSPLRFNTRSGLWVPIPLGDLATFSKGDGLVATLPTILLVTQL